MTKKLLNLHNIELKGKRVFVRVDFNVPLDDKGAISDDRRIEAAVPTIEYLLDQGCSIVLASHMGRPDGKVVHSLSLSPIAERLAEILDHKVEFIAEAIGPEVESIASKLKPGQIVMLENLRFYPEEEKNGIEFARDLAALADVYVDDAFACVHRAHASIVGIPAILPHAAGFLVEEEFHTLHDLLVKPAKPFVAIIGGAKVADKFELLDHLLDIVDSLVIGGAMANTFLLAEGYDVGKSICEPELTDKIKAFTTKAKAKHVELIVPTDVVVAKEIKVGIPKRTVLADEIGKEDIALDLGPDTTKAIEKVIKEAKTIFWNGTLGYTEIEQFAVCSSDVAAAVIASDAKSIIGGGDTSGFLDRYSRPDKFGFISTGGGAALELLAGKALPGIVALQQ